MAILRFSEIIGLQNEHLYDKIPLVNIVYRSYNNLKNSHSIKLFNPISQSLSLPMFTVLRRFSILMTMILEFYILKTRPKRLIIFAVFIMIFGAIVAASNDLAFEARAYAFILANDVFTAANGVYTKNNLNRSDIGKYGLIFYNSLFSLPFVLLLVYFTGHGIRNILRTEMT